MLRMRWGQGFVLRVGGRCDIPWCARDGRRARIQQSSSQIEAIAKARESEARAKEDKIGFMKEVEDRERGDAYRRQELNAKLMDAVKPVAAGYCADAGGILRGV